MVFCDIRYKRQDRRGDRIHQKVRFELHIRVLSGNWTVVRSGLLSESDFFGFRTIARFGLKTVQRTLVRSKITIILQQAGECWHLFGI